LKRTKVFHFRMRENKKHRVPQGGTEGLCKHPYFHGTSERLAKMCRSLAPATCKNPCGSPQGFFISEQTMKAFHTIAFMDKFALHELLIRLL
jgi:hypothetical protein